MEPALSDRVTDIITATLREHPSCLQIVLFLLQNETAMDTPRGIATWWVRCDEVIVQAALDCLVTCGAVATYRLGSGNLYGLTRNQEIRAWLRATYGGVTKRHRRGGGDGKRS